MIPFTTHQRFFLYGPATDMRKGFDSLSRLVQVEMGKQCLSGDAFIFINRKRDLVKILVWDRTGFVIWHKRLESGTFEVLSWEQNQSGIEMRWDELVMMLEGIKLSSVIRRKRYRQTG